MKTVESRLDNLECIAVSSSSTANNAFINLMRIGNMCIATGAMQSPGNSQLIPVGFRPLTTVTFNATTLSNAGVFGSSRLTIYSNGRMSASAPPGVGGRHFVSAYYRV